MDVRELQGRWLLDQRLLDQATIARAFDAATQRGEVELCPWLLANGLISPEVARRLRSETSRPARFPPSGSAGLAPASGRFDAARPGTDRFDPAGGTRLDSGTGAHSGRPARQGLGAGFSSSDGFTSGEGFASGEGFYSGEGAVSGELIAPVATTAPGEPRAGGAFREYQLVKEISRGAMGVVFLAEDKDGAELAIKFMLRGSTIPSEVERFRREAEALIPLKHPNIIEIRDFGEEDGRLFYAMEFVRGTDVKEYVRDAMRTTDAPPPREHILEIYTKIASALAHIHERGIVHRDIKPQNILLEDGTDRPVLADFGLLKRESDGETDGDSVEALTKTGEIVGTPAFMSPEQFCPDGRFGPISEASDVWSFTCSLFEGLVGCGPFERATMIEVYQAVVDEPLPDPAADIPSAPDWLLELIRDGLARRPEDRPTMAEVAERLTTGARAEAAVSDQGRMPLILGGLAVAAGLVVVLLLVLRPPEPPTLAALSREPEDALVTRPTLKVRGRILHPRGLLTLGGKPVPITTDGRFVANLTLDPGENRVPLLLTEADKSLLREELRVTFDRGPPAIDFSTSATDDEFVVGSDLVLAGRVSDDTAVQLTVDGRPEVVGADGAFRVLIKDSREPTKIRLVATDAAGHTTEREVTVVTPAVEQQRASIEILRELARAARTDFETADAQLSIRRAEASRGLDELTAKIGLSTEQRAALDPLRDLKAWRDASPSARDSAGQLVASLIGEGFTRLEDGLYETRDGPLPIARYRHRKSGLTFHLCPGGTRRLRLWLNPEVAVAVARLKGLLRAGRSQSGLVAGFVDAPYRRFVRHLCDQVQVEYRTDAEDEARRGKDDDDDEARERRKAQYTRIVQAILAQPNRFERFQSFVQRSLDAYYEREPSEVVKTWVPPLLAMNTELPQSVAERFGAGRFDAARLTHGCAPDRAHYFATANDMTRLAEALGDGLRLPRYREWRHLACAGTADDWPGPPGSPGFKAAVFDWSRARDEDSGDGDSGDGGRIQPVTRHRDVANGFGLSDMVGHVEEWCEPDSDLWAIAFPDETYPEDSQERAVLAGGSIWVARDLISAATFANYDRTWPWNISGGRFVRSLEPAERSGD